MKLKAGYCPICDDMLKVYSDKSMCHCPVCGHDIALHEIDEDDISKILKNPDSKITLSEAKTMVSVLQKSVIDRDESLKEKIIGAHSFYEGEYNVLHIAEVMLQKLTLNEEI